MRRIPLSVLAGLLIHSISFLLMLMQVEPFQTFFYALAWWSYILMVAGVNHRMGSNSLMLDRRAEFVRVFFLSVITWFFFELYNFRLQNWHYLGAPEETYLRWPGYFIAFGTVLPGIFETTTLIGNLKWPPEGQGRILRVGPGLLTRCLILGLLMMAAPLISPDIFFPFVWVGLVLLLDPLIYRLGAIQHSLIGQAQEGNYTLLLRLLLAGAICGVLWEFWNFWAGSKWIYTIPYLGFWKVFEMPLLGFLGFPVFAVECYLIYRFYLLASQTIQDRWSWARWPLLALAFLFCALVIGGIEAQTIISYRVVVGW